MPKDSAYAEYVLDIVLQHQHYAQHPLEQTLVHTVKPSTTATTSTYVRSNLG
jgi:hypothetical protein